MKGIQRTKRFYNELFKTALKNILKVKFAHVSAAYLGEGSEILGFDDTISEDHNYWPRIYVFFADDDFDGAVLA